MRKINSVIFIPLFCVAFHIAGCKSSHLTRDASVCGLSKNVTVKLVSTTCRIEELLSFSIQNTSTQGLYVSNPKSYSNLHLTLLEMNDSKVTQASRINPILEDKKDFFQLDEGKVSIFKYEFSLAELFIVERKKTYKLEIVYKGLITTNQNSKACEFKIESVQLITTK